MYCDEKKTQNRWYADMVKTGNLKYFCECKQTLWYQLLHYGLAVLTPLP